MSCKAELTNIASKQLEKINKSNQQIANKIQAFLDFKLTSDNDPCILPNAKKLKGFSDNRYRWRIGDYRIIGVIDNSGNPIIISIIRIAHRQEAY